jgi:hypothetical protein
MARDAWCTARVFPGRSPAEVVAMTASRPDAYDDAPSALRGHVDDLTAWLAIWEGRREPDAHAAVPRG